MASQPPTFDLPVAQGPFEPHELWIFANGELAHRAGFHRDRRCHRSQPQLRAWWPTLAVDEIRGFEFCRVIITDEVRRAAYGNTAKEENLSWMLHEARKRLRRAPMLWIDL